MMITKLLLASIMTLTGINSSSIMHYEFENILPEPKVFVMKATPLSGACDNKAVVPVKLPKSAEGWYYEITFAPKHKAIHSAHSLLQEVIELSGQNSLVEIADHIETDQTRQQANIYILRGKEYADSFLNCGFFYHHGKYIGSKSKSGYVKNTDGETFYIGIERNSDWKGLQVKVELVAVK